MALKVKTFAIGDEVRFKDQPEIVGTLMKSMGQDIWVVKVDGEEKSRIAKTDNLELLDGQFAPENRNNQPAPEKYSIVGTWDDWELHDMAWNAELQAFEYKVVLSKSGHEDFKFLVDASWGKCIYPNCKHANPWMSHTINGPNDGGFDEAWTIGKHDKDHGVFGAAYTVRLHVLPNGHPKCVTWEYIRNDGNPTMETAVAQGQAKDDMDVVTQKRQQTSKLWNSAKENNPLHNARHHNKNDTEHAEEYRSFRGWPGKQSSENCATDEARYKPRQISDFGLWDRNKNNSYEHERPEPMEEDIVEIERAARERLARRFEAAAEAERLMLEDQADVRPSSGDTEAEERGKGTGWRYYVAMRHAEEKRLFG